MRESERGGKREGERETAEMKKMKQDLNQLGVYKVRKQ